MVEYMEKIINSINSYIHKLDALAYSFPVVMKSTNNAVKHANKSWLDYMEEKCTSMEIDDDGKTKKFKIPQEYLRENHRKKVEFEKINTALTLLPRNYLVSFVSEYDAYLGNLCKAIYSAKPELLHGCERHLTFGELSKFKNMDDARDYLLNKEVESLLRKSHAEQFKSMESKFSVTLTKELDSWCSFVELTERRNLLVHCEGIVSEQYIANCTSHGCKISDIEVGKELNVNTEYLRQSYICLYEIGVKLSQVLWRKQFPDKCDSADESLIEITYDLLANERYDIAKSLLKFSVDTIKNHSSEINKRVLCINLSLAHLYLNEQEECLKAIGKYDWSACGDEFKLAIAVIKGEDSNVYSIMKELGNNNKKVPKEAYIEWPLFKNYRDKSGFKNVFDEIFGGSMEVNEEFHNRIDE